MIATWKCPVCDEGNHLQVRNKLTIAAGESETFTDEVVCWQCGEIYYLKLDMSVELQEHELRRNQHA